jgi:hypothetical protein
MRRAVRLHPVTIPLSLGAGGIIGAFPAVPHGSPQLHTGNDVPDARRQALRERWLLV